MRYRRVKIPGGTFFFTINLADRRSTLLTDCIASLREAVRTVKLRHPCHIHAWVVLPEHMHAIWTMPGEDDDYSMRWMLIKQRFSRAIASYERVNASKRRKGERGVWQRRFWEHQIRDDIDLGHHIDYVHINPVKHGYVERASAWPYSSIHQYIRRGDLAPDWACDPDLHELAGERL